MKPKKSLLELNVFVKDCSKEDMPIIRKFATKEEAKEFIEEFERPNDLVCDFSSSYFKYHSEVQK